MHIKIMGILNATPDSFFDSYPDPVVAAVRALAMPADIIDIGGESTRPGSLQVSENEELDRVLPVISLLKGSKSLSIDTYKPAVAEKALAAGCSIINDVTGLENPLMRELAASTSCPAIIMHSRGLHAKMGKNTLYEEGVVPHLISWFEKRITLLLNAGIKKENIIIDPGIGFDKTPQQNYEILKGIPILKTLGFPLLIGLSRKSFLNKSLAATIAANTYAVLQGADIMRVHDVQEARHMIDFVANIQKID